MARGQRRAYEWQALEASGRVVNGQSHAANEHLLRLQLRRQGLRPQQVRRAAPSWWPGVAEPRLRRADVGFLLRLLATMLSAGLPLAQALSLAAARRRDRAWTARVEALQRRVEAGEALAAAMARQPASFDALLIGLIDAGEKSGNLDTALQAAAAYRERLDVLRRQAGRALLYPAVVLGVALLVAGILLTVVVPKFELMFAGFGAELPPLTRAVIAASDAVRRLGAGQWLLLVAAVGGAVVVTARSRRLRDGLEGVALRLPLLGPILAGAALARVHRTLATSCAAGVPLVEALATAADVAGRRPHQLAVLAVRDAVLTGIELQVAMQRQSVFPTLAVQLVGVGEAAGTLDAMCVRVAEYYEAEVEGRIETLSTLLEPVVMLVIAGLVGGLVIAMYLPIFQLGEVMG